MIAQEAYEVPYDKDLRWTSRERLEHARSLVKKINELRQCVGASERIAQTPVPLHYARHASRFLSLWCFLLPLALVDQLGLFTAPATAFIVWGLFGLREIGTLDREPLHAVAAAPDRVGHARAGHPIPSPPRHRGIGRAPRPEAPPPPYPHPDCRAPEKDATRAAGGTAAASGAERGGGRGRSVTAGWK